jgi:hypothetical protein
LNQSKGEVMLELTGPIGYLVSSRVDNILCEVPCLCSVDHSLAHGRIVEHRLHCFNDCLISDVVRHVWRLRNREVHTTHCRCSIGIVGCYIYAACVLDSRDVVKLRRCVSKHKIVPATVDLLQITSVEDYEVKASVWTMVKKGVVIDLDYWRLMVSSACSLRIDLHILILEILRL